MTNSFQHEMLSGKMLPVMEEFVSLQGEGFHTGSPAYFLRIGGCDVGCHWCDVKESWNAALHPLVSVHDVVNRALQQTPRAVVVTGGEPLLYNLNLLTDLFRTNGFVTFLETSGSESMSGNWDWICLSPKKTAHPLEQNLLLADELKVVVETLADFDWAEQNAARVGKECRLFLQPEWSQAEKILPSMVEYIIAHPGWSLSLQTHKYIGIP